MVCIPVFTKGIDKQSRAISKINDIRKMKVNNTAAISAAVAAFC